MKVTFRPSREEHVEFHLERQKQLQSKSMNNIIWLFLIFNLGILPGFLIVSDLFWLALAAFTFNLVVMGFFWSSQQRKSVRKPLEKTWPELDEFDCEIEIDEQGLRCEHAGNRNFYPWRNIETIGSTNSQIFFDVGPVTVLLAKRAFVDEHGEKDFFEQAQQYKKVLKSDE